MKRNTYMAIIALALATVPFATRAGNSHQNMVMEHGAEVMPFDQKQAVHMFLPSVTGGVIEIVVHDMEATQIALVRAHLLQEAPRRPLQTVPGVATSKCTSPSVVKFVVV